MSRDFKIFLVVLVGLMVWMTVVDTLYMVPHYGAPIVVVLVTAVVLVIQRVVRPK
jgi:hypothetical protein